jgi:hypothetical protein
MKKMLILAAILSFAGAAKGFVIGLQLGDVALGFGGSRSGGPVFLVGRAPDNGLPLSAVIVPGDRCCCEEGCKNRTCCTR